MSEQRTKNADDLREASVHVFYEWKMFNDCIHRSQRMEQPPADEKLFNTLLTAFGIHTRNLLDFFYPPRNVQSDDMLARHWFENSSHWENIQPPLTDNLIKTREMVNKLNSHLTYKRVTWSYEQRYWEWTKIQNDMDKIWNTFITNVTSENLIFDSRNTLHSYI